MAEFFDARRAKSSEGGACRTEGRQRPGPAEKRNTALDSHHREPRTVRGGFRRRGQDVRGTDSPDAVAARGGARNVIACGR